MTTTTLQTAPLFLVEITVYDPALGTTKVLRYSSGLGFTTKPSGTPASTFYDARIKQPIDIRRTMFSGASTMGRSTVGIGDLVLYNDDGALDELNDYGFDGQAITVYRTTTLTPSYPSDFTSYVLTMDAHPDFSNTEIRIKLRDRQQIVASTPLQTTKYAGSNSLPNGLEGVSDLLGKPKPVCYGVVKNVPAPCVNTSKLIYQVNDGAINSVDAVYDRGIPLSIGFYFTDFGGGASSGTYTAVAYGGGLFVAVGTNHAVTTSTDTVTWTTRTPATSSVWACAAFGNGLYLIAGDSGALNTSPDGITWTSRTSTFGTDSVKGIAYGGGVYVAVGTKVSTNGIASSADGISWTQRTNPVANTLSAVCYGNNLFVAVGIGGVICTSPDGTTWTSRTSGVSASLAAVEYGGGVYVAVGASGTLLTSPDGIVWTIRTSGTTDNLAACIYAGTFHVVAGNSSATPMLFSHDGGGVEWTGRVTAVSCFGFAYNGTKIVCAQNTSMRVSQSAGTYSSQADLLDDSLAPPPGTFNYYAAGGYFRLGSRPDGLITADVTQGANAAARTHAQIWKNVALRCPLLTP